MDISTDRNGRKKTAFRYAVAFNNVAALLTLPSSPPLPFPIIFLFISLRCGWIRVSISIIKAAFIAAKIAPSLKYRLFAR